MYFNSFKIQVIFYRLKKKVKKKRDVLFQPQQKRSAAAFFGYFPGFL